MFLLNNPKNTGLFNIGTGKARSWNDIARSMFATVGKQTNIEYFDMPEILRGKYQYFTEAKMDKIKKTGCNHKFMELEDSIKDYCCYLKNKSYL